jgi:hypothetical protein
MKKVTIQLSLEELQALVTMADNQFFRMKYIDPKMPGYHARPDELKAAQSAVGALQAVLRTAKGFKPREAENGRN